MSPPLTHGEWGEICGELIARNGGGDQYLYIQVTRGAEFGRNHAWPEGLKPTLFAFATALEPLAPRCSSRAWRRSPPRTRVGRGATSSPPHCSRTCC